MKQDNQNLDENGEKIPTVEAKERLDKVMFYSIVSCLIAVIVSSLLMLTHSRLNDAQKMKFAVVDLALIVETLKDQTRVAALASDSDEKRAIILERFGKKMSTLEEMLKKESDSCQCNILVKSALPANYDIPDLTQNLMKALKIKQPPKKEVLEEELEP